MTTLAEPWVRVRDGDERALGMYRRHYSSARRPRNAQRQFVGPGESLILMTPSQDALFVWRYELYRLDEEAGVNCAVFRNEGVELSSQLIRAADVRAWERWPGQRLFTFVDPAEVHSPNPGFCFKAAGWRYVRTTPKGLHVLEILPGRGGAAEQ